MSFIDVIIIALLLWAAYAGYRQGLIVAVLSLVGVVGGALLALRLSPPLLATLADSGARLALGIACLVLGIGLGELAGSFLGRKLSRKVTWRPAVQVDRALGMIGHTFAVLLVTWMAALPLAAAPIPWLSSAVRDSALLAKTDAAMPAAARDLSAALGRALNSSGFPTILDPLGRTPAGNVAAPDPGDAGSSAIDKASRSVLKVLSEARQCNRGMEGTGFVIAPEYLMTNAHVVAGASLVAVEVGSERLRASVVRYDPHDDVAVLHVPGLTRPALKFASGPVEVGAGAVVAGYPLNGPLTVGAARIAQRFDLRGPDIYADATVLREVYTLRGTVRPGNSGGPLLAPDGTVIGVIFGAAPDVANVGYALTAEQVRDDVQAARGDRSAASTGACMPQR